MDDRVREIADRIAEVENRIHEVVRDPAALDEYDSLNGRLRVLTSDLCYAACRAAGWSWDVASHLWVRDEVR